jgi:hypothetical protein
MSTPGGPEPLEPVDAVEWGEPAKQRRVPGRRAWIAVGVGVAVVASAGAGFAAGSVVGGGGTQPEDVLPDTVVAYVDIDLDPAAQQKVNLVRLLGRFPDVEQEYGSEPDVRTLVVDWLVDGTELEDADVSAWIGDRVGVGVSWDAEAEALTPVAALQVTDEDAAVADLGLVLDPEQMAVTDGYVVVTGDLLNEFAALDTLDGLISDAGPGAQSATEIVAAGKSAPLSESAGFIDVFDHLEDGLLTMYADGEGIAAAGDQLVTSLGVPIPSLNDSLASAAESGQIGAVLRAEPDALEFVSWSSSDPQSGAEPAQLMPVLPESTLFAVEVTGGQELVADRWDEVLDSVNQSGGQAAAEMEADLATLEAQYGIKLPEDLETLAGQDAVIAVDGEGLLTSVPGIGMRSVTDPAAGSVLADSIESALASLTGGFGITAQGTSDGMVVATTDDYAAQLEAGDGDLGADPTYQAALHDAENATSLMWVDFSAVRGFAALAAPEEASVLKPLEAFGATVSPDDGGSLVRARLVFSDGSDS